MDPEKQRRCGIALDEPATGPGRPRTESPGRWRGGEQGEHGVRSRDGEDERRTSKPRPAADLGRPAAEVVGTTRKARKGEGLDLGKKGGAKRKR